MGMPNYTSLSAVSCSATINMDYRRNPMNAAVAVTGSSSGTFTYSVLFTLDDQQELTNTGSTRAPVFFPDANLNGVSSNGTTNYMFPVAGLRLSVTAVSSATVTMCILQGD
jgi:hypothetical protein